MKSKTLKHGLSLGVVHGHGPGQRSGGIGDGGGRLRRRRTKAQDVAFFQPFRRGGSKAR